MDYQLFESVLQFEGSGEVEDEGDAVPELSHSRRRKAQVLLAQVTLQDDHLLEFVRVLLPHQIKQLYMRRDRQLVSNSD